MVNQLYEDIASYGEDGVKADILMESLKYFYYLDPLMADSLF